MATNGGVERYDAIVIGAGQAGGPLAGAFAGAGRKTALIEREHIGGTCINEGCTPTKTMIASGRVGYLARRGGDYGVQTGDIAIEMTKVRQRKRDIVASFRGGSERRLRETEHLDVIDGEARFVDATTVTVTLTGGGTRTLASDLIAINAGARPAIPKVEGADTVTIYNSTSIMELDAVPGHLVVLGGGYVGLEFGQLFRRLGAQVTVIQRGKHLLGREDPDIADAVAGILGEDGIEILLESDAVRVEQVGEGVAVTVKTPDGERTLNGTHVLAAAGRSPNTDRLNPEAAGIQLDKRGYLPVDERLATNVPGIYALGDITGGPAFTHISYDDFRILRTNLIEGGDRTTTGRLVPYTVFTDPQLGRVGLSETEAREQGRQIKVASMPMSNVARALEVDESRGVMKVIVDAETERILGAAILGLEGGEIMSMLQLAMMGDLPYTTLRDGVFAHPTLAESLNNLFGTFKDE